MPVLTSDIPFSSHPVALLTIGAVVPLGGYVLNALLALAAKSWPAVKWLDNEKIKGGVHVVLVGIATAWWNSRFKHGHFERDFASLMLTAAYAHNLLWKPSGANVALGARPSGSQRTTGISARIYDGSHKTPAQVAEHLGEVHPAPV